MEVFLPNPCCQEQHKTVQLVGPDTINKVDLLASCYYIIIIEGLNSRNWSWCRLEILCRSYVIHRKLGTCVCLVIDHALHNQVPMPKYLPTPAGKNKSSLLINNIYVFCPHKRKVYNVLVVLKNLPPDPSKAFFFSFYQRPYESSHPKKRE